MASNEVSILISCTTSLALGLIKPHVSLDNSPPGSNAISISPYQPRNDKTQFNIHLLWEKSKTKLETSTKKISDVCSIQEQSSTSSNKEQFYDECSRKEHSKQDENCQADKYAHIQPKKPTNHMWVNRPAMPIQQRVPQEDDKNCQVNMKLVCDGKKGQSTKYIKSEYNDFKSQSTVSSDKNCQDNKSVIMQPVSQKWICGHPNQQLQDCIVTKTVNPQDATRRRIMTRTVKKFLMYR